jgi:hypothetical protein
LKSSHKFSAKELGPAFEVWSRDFNDQPVTQTEKEYSDLVFLAERFTYTHGGIWPTLAQLEEWIEATAEKSDQTTTWPTHAEEQKEKDERNSNTGKI